MQDSSGSFMSLQTDSFEVAGPEDTAKKTSVLKLDIPGEKKADYVEAPIICRVIYGNYSVTSDAVILKYEEAAKPSDPASPANNTDTTKPTDASKNSKTSKSKAPVVKKVSIKNVKKLGKNEISVKWEKNKKASGYQLAYKLSGKKYKTITIRKKGTTSYKLKNLKSGKKYILRIRAYRKYKGKKIYSKWSKKKTVKIKK
jgi:hypothetical protein